VLNLANGLTNWATMNTPIQQVVEDLFLGETTAVVGTPEHLAPQTFAYLINMTARRPLVVSGFAAVATPGTGAGSCTLTPQAGIHPETQKMLNKLSGSGSAAVAAIGSNGFKGAMNTCTVNVCIGGVSTPQKFYCPPQ
jgi:hypothetical protein